MFERINDPSEVSAGSIRFLLGKGKWPTVQFSKPGYSPTLLRAINALCGLFGDALEVRFFGHYKEGFDASILRYLPAVQRLSIDCLTHISNMEALYNLKKIRRLSFGVYDFNETDLLSRIRIENLEELRLGENAKRNFDLGPLKSASALRTLSIEGHVKNIVGIAGHSRLEELTLRCTPKKQRLDFVNSLSSLSQLRVVLGGRDNIDELKHSALMKLEVVRVRGLSNLDFLRNLPKLEILRVEDQLRLESLDFDADSPQLRHISILNCKNLVSLTGLQNLHRLAHLRISRTGLDPESFLDTDFPTSLDVLALYTKGGGQDKKIRKILDEKGYSEFS